MATDLPLDAPRFNKQYQNHLKCLKLAGLQPKTVDAYSRAIRRIGDYFDYRIDNLSSDQLLDYFSRLLETHSWSTVKLDLYGLKFFYTHILKKDWQDIPLVKKPKATRIPDIITTHQINELLATTKVLSYKVFFYTIYSMGLRLSEGINLKVGDIDSHTMRVHIRDSKGNKDRLVPLPVATLTTMKQFWSLHRHPQFIFPSRKHGAKLAHTAKVPLNRGGVQQTITKVVKQIGIKKRFPAIPCATVSPPTCLKLVWILSRYRKSLAMSPFSPRFATPI